MMNDDDFPPNPFRSNPTTTEQEDFFTGGGNTTTTTATTTSGGVPLQPQQQHDPFAPVSTSSSTFQQHQQSMIPTGTMQPMTMPQNTTTSSTSTTQQPTPSPSSSSTASRWNLLRLCCKFESYKIYFDVDTMDIQTRLKAVWTTFYQRDTFRNGVLGIERGSGDLKGPDLYGPFWITMTLVFVLALTSNIAAFLHTDNVSEFEYDIEHLIRASIVLSVFWLGVPFVFWILTQCLGMQGLLLVDWVCLYGYSLLFYIPAAIFCLIPIEVFIWVVLLVATFMSVLLVVRNVASPLLSADVTQAKSGPLLMAVLGGHTIFLLVLKFLFYTH